jgi:hypothetical protein
MYMRGTMKWPCKFIISTRLVRGGTETDPSVPSSKGPYYMRCPPPSLHTSSLSPLRLSSSDAPSPCLCVSSTGYAIRNRYNFLTKRSLEEARRHLRAPAPLFLPPTALHHYAAHMAHQHQQQQQQQQQMQYEQGQGQGGQWGQAVGGMASGAGVVSQYSAHEQGGEEEEGGHRDSKRRRGEDGVGHRQEQGMGQGVGQRQEQSEHPLSSLMHPNYFTDLQHTYVHLWTWKRAKQTCIMTSCTCTCMYRLQGADLCPLLCLVTQAAGWLAGVSR